MVDPSSRRRASGSTTGCAPHRSSMRWSISTRRCAIRIDPGRIRAQWTTDWLHPDDAGYQAMADALVNALDRAGLAPE